MLTVNLAPEVENQVRQNAAERGQDADQYLSQLIQLALRQPVPPVIPARTSPEEFLHRWGARASSRPPISAQETEEALTASAFRREDIYDDDGR